MSYPNAFIGSPVNPELPGFPLKTCGNYISRAIKQDTQISNRTTRPETKKSLQSFLFFGKTKAVEIFAVLSTRFKTVSYGNSRSCLSKIFLTKNG
ncbi:MAG: hypothetical protein CV082_03400 [Candidatus Brocadia sp. BL1]|nr:MAG: hypothetical protein CV082_03400 [Candidatus Brocadia sp. BL1]